MIKTELYIEIINQLPNMDSSQLKELADLAQKAFDLRKNYFNNLVINLEDALRTINAEFPNAIIPLMISPTEIIDLMDCIVPKDFVDRCQMGEIHNS